MIITQYDYNSIWLQLNMTTTQYNKCTISQNVHSRFQTWTRISRTLSNVGQDVINYRASSSVGRVHEPVDYYSLHRHVTSPLIAALQSRPIIVDRRRGMKRYISPMTGCQWSRTELSASLTSSRAAAAFPSQLVTKDALQQMAISDVNGSDISWRVHACPTRNSSFAEYTVVLIENRDRDTIMTMESLLQHLEWISISRIPS